MLLQHNYDDFLQCPAIPPRHLIPKHYDNTGVSTLPGKSLAIYQALLLT